MKISQLLCKKDVISNFYVNYPLWFLWFKENRGKSIILHSGTLWLLYCHTIPFFQHILWGNHIFCKKTMIYNQYFLTYLMDIFIHKQPRNYRLIYFKCIEISYFKQIFRKNILYDFNIWYLQNVKINTKNVPEKYPYITLCCLFQAVSSGSFRLPGASNFRFPPPVWTSGQCQPAKHFQTCRRADKRRTRTIPPPRIVSA